MTSGSQPPSSEQDENPNGSGLRRLAFLLLVLLGGFGCMLLAAQIAQLRMRVKPPLRDVRSLVQADYGIGERRAAPLVPQVIEAVQDDIEAVQPTVDIQLVTVVPVVEIPVEAPTAVVQVTPTPSATATQQVLATDTPTPTNTRVPAETPTPTPAVAAATATDTPAPSDTPMATAPATATDAPVPPTVTSSPTATSVQVTFTSTPTPTETPLPPTDTPTEPPPAPTATSTPTATAGITPTDTPTPSDTPAPSDTPVPTDTPTPIPTLTFTSTPAPPPVVLAIVPNEMTRGSSSDPATDVTVTGQNFLGSFARLGQSIFINVLTVADTIITGTLAPDIPTGIYALTVQNSDGQRGILPYAFTVHPRPQLTNTFDSDVAFVSAFGSAALATEGDDDHVQIIFFEVPDGPDDLLHIRIFDADSGDAHDIVGLDNVFGDTVITYTLRGGGGAYTDPDARSDHPGPVGIGSGTLVAQQAVGMDGILDSSWLTLSVNRSQGELVGSKRVFKLVVQGAAGDDGNRYQVAISTDPNSNSVVAGARIFAFSWCVALPNPTDEVALYPFVPAGSSNVSQINFDFDVGPGAAITLTTPLRDLPVASSGLSADGGIAFQDFTLFPDERATTWSARYVSRDVPPVRNDFSLWFLSDSANVLAIFTAPTLTSAP